MKNPSVFNIPRIAAENFKGVHSNMIWISISEKGVEPTKHEALDKIPNLKLEFWDLTETLEYKGEMIGPPTDEQAAQIVDFILANPGKHVVVNCAAGVSRSGAVAQFCGDILKYEWPSYYKSMAVPNFVLYRKMVNYYQENKIIHQLLAK